MKYFSHNRCIEFITLFIFLLAAPTIFSTTSFAAGLMKPTNNAADSLKILKHHVDVVIEDGYAITTVDQTFHNPHANDLEANYSFPIPEKAAVAEFTMWIDGKPVSGEVLEKKKARRVYEEEKQAGRDAGLTEKNEYKTFEIFVSPVRAQQDARIRLVYIQPAHVDTGIGRYVYPLEDGGVDEQTLKFWTSNDTVEENFSFDLQVRSGYPISNIRMPNQPNATISKIDPQQWQVNLSSSVTPTVNEEANTQPASTNTGATAYALDKDIVVYWKLAEGLPGHVDLITYKPDAGGMGTFMLSVTPGDDLNPIHEGKDWIFVLDISGSMQGKYASLAEGVQRALKKMRINDRFRIVTFNSNAKEITNGFVVASSENIDHYANKVASVNPSQGTNLYGGLKLGIDTIDADRSTGIVLVTDGVANVGETHQRNFLELIKKKDIRLFTFIMGNSANRPLLTAITKASGGFAVSVSNSDDIVGKILLAADKMTHAAFHGISLDISGIKTTNLTPRQVGSLYRGQQLIIFGQYWGNGAAEITLHGLISGQPKTYQTQIAFPSTSTTNPELERLWAFAMIEDLQEEMEDFGEKADLKQAATDIAVQYGLVTDYTSMVVLREDVFAARNIDRTNQRRLQVEKAAQQQRSQGQVTNRRADTNQPMFNSGGASLGGGSFNLWFSLLLLFAVYMRRTSAE